MGNCLGPPQNPPPRPGRWNHPQQRQARVPVLPGQPPMNQQFGGMPSKGALEHLEDLDEDGLYETVGGTVKKKPFQSKEVNINQTFLMQKYQGQCHQNFNNTVFVKVPINRE